MTGKTMQLGRYTLGDQLGSGGFGTVYKAADSIGRSVAVKVLKPGWADDPGTIERFRREAQVAGELFHNRIATIIDFDEFEGRLFLVMRYIDGIPLDKFIKGKSLLRWPESLQILSEVADGLDYAHQRGFIHRDIKPANILISDREGAVLTDFGLVKAAENSGMSTSGVMLGTPHYIAPEIWAGKPASPATDIYSLACVACEMLTGEVLFAGVSPPEIMTKHMQSAPPLPENWPAGVPEGIREVLTCALDIDPGKRYQNVTEFISALKKTEEFRQKETELRVTNIINEADALLAAGDLQQAEGLLSQASMLAPDSPAIVRTRQKVEESIRLARLYNEAADNHLAAEEKAKAVLNAAPDYPDSRGIFQKLGLRGKSKKAIPAYKPMPVDAELKLRWQEKSMPYLLIILGLATSWLGIGILGLVAGIALFQRKDWARKTGLIFAGLLEFAGFGFIYFMIGYMAIETLRFWETLELVLPGVAGGSLAVLFAFHIFQTLGGPRFAELTGGKVSRPTDTWKISIAFFTTILGIIPASMLLSRKKSSRTWARVYAFFLMIALPILGFVAAADMIYSWDFFNGSQIKYFYNTNIEGQIITAVVVLFFIVLCVLALRALQKPEMRAHLDNREG